MSASDPIALRFRVDSITGVGALRTSRYFSQNEVIELDNTALIVLLLKDLYRVIPLRS